MTERDREILRGNIQRGIFGGTDDEMDEMERRVLALPEGVNLESFKMWLLSFPTK